MTDNGKMPKVSILMPVYNCDRYIAFAIDSVLAQTFTDWELIICDDGSSDDTYKIAQEYVKRCKKIVLLKNKQNLKLNKTLNKCIEHARGEYVARMDGDDLMERNRLDLEAYFLDEHTEYALVSAQFDMFDESGVKGVAKRPSGEVRAGDFVQHPAVFCHSAVMMRRADLETVGGYSVGEKYVRVEDIDLWLKFYEHGYKGYNLSQVLYHQRDDADAAGRRTRQNYFNEYGIRKRSFKSLGLPKSKYCYVLRPIIIAFLPKWLYGVLHKKNLRQV